jgi:hypothetical protein
MDGMVPFPKNGMVRRMETVPEFVWLEGCDGMNMVQVISCIELVRLPYLQHLHMYTFQR